MELASVELRRMMDSEELKDSNLLVFANKQDMPHAMSCGDITTKLGLHTYTGRQWRIQGCCATSGDCVYEGLDWYYFPFL